MISRFRSLIQRNLPVKIAALLVAVILWGYVMNEQNPATDASFTVPVQLVNAPDGYNIKQGSDTIKIKVRGARSLFVSNNEDNFRAYVDLNGAEDGKKAYKVQVELPQGFELVEAKPETIDVTLDRIIKKRVRADINVNGAPAQGTTVAKINQASPQVVVEGPESAVNEVDRVIGYVGLNGKNDTDFDLQVPLTAINADGREVQGVTVQPSTMYVTVTLARGLSKKIVMIHAVTDTDLTKGYELAGLRVDPMKVEIAGNEQVISGITSLDTEKISLADIVKNTDKNVKLVLPDGVTVTNREVVVHIIVREKKNE